MNAHKYETVVCAVIKDELDLEEWLAYHLVLGFNHIFVYDHASQSPLKCRLKNWSTEVTIVDQWPDTRGSVQLGAYDHFLHTFGSETKWAAFIDGDEYIVLKQASQIDHFLANYNNVQCVGLNWLYFGANGHERRPESGFVIENYTRRDRNAQRCMKRIVQPAYVTSADIHCLRLVKGAKDVDVLHRRVRGPFNAHVNRNEGQDIVEIACLHHYHSKSREDWSLRLRRGQAGSIHGGIKRTAEEFDRNQETHNEVSDLTLKNSHFPRAMREIIAHRRLSPPM